METYHSLLGFHEATMHNATAITGIPAVDTVANLVQRQWGINPSTLLSLLVPLATLVAAVKYCWGSIYDNLFEYLTATAEIKMEDEMYNYVMHWISQQSFTRSTRNFVAGTKIASDFVDDSSDDEDEADGAGESFEMQQGSETFDQYWERLMSRDRIKHVYITPAYGKHYFRYRGRIIWFTREAREQAIPSWHTQKEKLYLTCFGRDPQIIKELLKEAQELFVKRDGQNTIIYRAGKFDASSMFEWHRCMARPSRPLSTVVLDLDQKRAIVEDVKEYLHPMTRKWYANRGIPYRRGYIFHGPPGTGKSSLSIALAALFSLPIYIIDLNSRSLNEEELANLFSTLPQRCILLLEDIDSAGMTQKRSRDMNAADLKSSGSLKDEEAFVDAKVMVPAPSTTTNEPDPKSGAIRAQPISMSALLNAIDGVASSEGRILVMTTNHIDRLDAALLRPGRVDMKVQFSNATAATAKALFRFMFTNDTEPEANNDKKIYLSSPSTTPPVKSDPHSNTDAKSATAARWSCLVTSLAEDFAARIPENEFSPAEVQGYLLKHKRNPEAAVAGVNEWVEQMRLERQKVAGI